MKGMATEPDLEMEELDCNPGSTPLDQYDESQVQQLLRLTDSLMEQGQSLDSEIDAISPNDQGARPLSEIQKNKFMFIVTQVIFILQQAFLLFPELLGSQTTMECSRSSLAWQLLRKDDLDVDSMVIQYFLMNKQNCLACVRFMQLEEGTWVRPKSRFYFYRFFLDLYDNGNWQEIMKMSQQTFFWLCDKMAPHIRKNDTNYRQAIPVPCRLAACIYKLVRGCRSAEIMSKFGIGRSTLYSILRQVIPGIIEVLGQHIEWPTGQTFHETIIGIQEICGFPNCAGVVGGCDIPIVAPSDDPWAYMNVNQEYSVVLQVVCNHERKFNSVYVGKAGSMEYSGVLRSSSLYERASSSTLLNEDPFMLPCGSDITPYLLGNSGYPCVNWLMTPYKDSTDGLLGPMQIKYNEKLQKGMCLVDQSFSILKSTFAELATPCLLDIELVPQMIGACCVLHNILIDRKDIKLDMVEWDGQQSLVKPEGAFSEDGELDEFQDSKEALMKRDTLAFYLTNLPSDDFRS